MWFKFNVWLRDPGNTLWLTPTIGAIIGILISFVSYFVDRHWAHLDLPQAEIELIVSLLTVISSSMLAVSTFSLSTMVAAYSSASNGVTPRATQLVMGDDNSRIAIASFIAAFIFSLIAQLTLGLEILGNTGRFILLISTVLMLIYVVFSLIRWIGALSQLGRLGNTMDKLNKVAFDSLSYWRLHPTMQAHASESIWKDGVSVYAKKCQYVTHIDQEALQLWAEKHNAQIQLCAVPGVLLSPERVLLKIRGIEELNEADCAHIVDCFVYSLVRVYEQDPRYGMIVLSEVALRALSVGVNDPGTSILVFNHMLEVLIDAKPDQEFQQKRDEKGAILYDRLHIMMFDEKDLISQPFAPIIFFAADDLVLVTRLLKILHKIHVNIEEEVLAKEAKEQATILMRRAQEKLTFADDWNVVRNLYVQLFEEQPRQQPLRSSVCDTV